ncbi:unnamed protein product [Durusdinium trenchii]|uniref:Uncharacterized protein n=1 Tax=Durusdinium trenchii TaxID=1381693 RepID=A0ABP0KXV1_9DINO
MRNASGDSSPKAVRLIVSHETMVAEQCRTRHRITRNIRCKPGRNICFSSLESRGGGCGRRLRKAAAVVLECLQRLDVDPRLKPSQRLKKLIQKFQQMSLEFQQSLQKLTAPAGAVMCHEAKFSEHTCQRYSEIEKARCFVDHVRLEDWLCQPCLHGKLLPWCFRKTKIPRVSWLSLPTWQVEIL